MENHSKKGETVREQKYRLGFDIGGTFTDFLLVDEEAGRFHLGKCLTTPEDPAIGVMQGIGPVLEDAGISGSDIDIAIHGTTLITNALIERAGAKTAFLTTEGFRDVPEMGTEVRYDIYDLFLRKPETLVPRNHRYEVRERIDYRGDVVIPLDEADLRTVADRMRSEGVEAVAVAFLHSFRNASHEERAGAVLAETIPGIRISLSSAVAPEIREYERMSTAIANAYVQPLTDEYIETVERGLTGIGYRRRLYLMISSGGITTGTTARAFPIRMVESGPTAGVLAAQHYGRRLGQNNLVTFDMGGTTAKIGVVKNGNVAKAGSIEVARVDRFKKGSGMPIKVPVVELIEIGAGGGSIASVDQLGLLKVGPRSAGASPGPACYGLGGTEPTVTDANVVLGYLDPGYFLGGTMPLDADVARTAIEEYLCKPLGLSLTEAARGIFAVVNQNMLAATKVHVAERGEDPRKFHLFAFGGAGPAHGYELARALGMQGVIVPPGAGAASALGLVTTAVSFDFARSLVSRLDRTSWSEVANVPDAMRSEGLSVIAEAGVDPEGEGTEILCSVDMRHKGQGHEVTVPIPQDVLDQRSLDVLSERFYAAHVEQYGHAHRELPVELITCRVTVSGPPPDVGLRPLGTDSGSGEPPVKGHRPVYFPEVEEFVSTAIYDRYRLPPGTRLSGPAVVEERECTIVAGPSSTLHVDEYGTLFIDLLHAGEDP